MRKLTFTAILFSIALFFQSCDVIKGIFEAGVWTGVFAIIALIALFIYLFTRNKK